MRAGKRVQGQGGYTFVAVLCFLALLSVQMMVCGQQWSSALQRDKEQDLARVATRYVAAIERYYASNPGTLKEYPVELAQLLHDPRYVGEVRYLRRLYEDPFNPGHTLEPVRDAQGFIKGVRSVGKETPFLHPPRASGSAPARISDIHFLVSTP